jgi:hypothetical protein
MVDGGLVRVANWPAALADKDVAEFIKDAAYEGYEQKAGHRVGIYRV